VKRGALLQHVRRHGCVLKREGRADSLWINPNTGAIEAVLVSKCMDYGPHCGSD
jgi:hypothetical protein